jgi:hypothetical protein
MNVLRRVFRYLLITVGTLLAVASVAYLCLLFYAYKPYIEVTEVRASDQLQTVRITSTMGCEDPHYEADDGRRYMPLVPTDGKDVGDGIGLFVTGNSFILTGYPYKARLRNIFTGKVVEQHSERFDVVAWNIVVPYRRPGVNGEDIESNEPLGWKSEELNPMFANSVQKQSSGC